MSAVPVSTLDLPGLLALAAALGWASGIRLYMVVFAAGTAGALGLIELPPGLGLLAHPAMIGAAGVMLTLEFFADKIPGIDSLWDLIHSVLRVPAGAALAGAALGVDGPVMAALGAVLGATLASSAQLAKTTLRAAVNTLPEPFTNVAASLTEDGLALSVLWLAVTKPLMLAVVLTALVLTLAALTWICWRFLAAGLRRLGRAGREHVRRRGLR